MAFKGFKTFSPFCGQCLLKYMANTGSPLEGGSSMTFSVDKLLDWRVHVIQNPTWVDTCGCDSLINFPETYYMFVLGLILILHVKVRLITFN